MGQTSKNILKDVSQLSLEYELQNLYKLNMDEIMYQALSDEQVSQLAEKIMLLPLEYKNILLFRYCFDASPSEIEKMLEIENPISKLRYIKKMLSEFIGLKGFWIEDDSMEKACQIVLLEETKDYDNIPSLHNPSYSKKFRIKLKYIEIQENFSKSFMLAAKRVAIFILASTLSFSAVLAVNVEAREIVFGWVVETFPSFTIFTPKTIYEKNQVVDLTSFKVNYIPEGFELENIYEGRKMLIYNFIGDSNQDFTIKLTDISGQGKSYYDTENSEIKEITFKGSPAYIWEADKINYLIWYQDDVEANISGKLSKNEILKIAENISK